MFQLLNVRDVMCPFQMFPAYNTILTIKGLDISQIAVTFTGISPPLFIQAGLQQLCSSSFLDSTYRSFTKNNVFRTWLSVRETLSTHLFFMGRFRFTRIRLNLAPRLHTGDCFDIHNLHEKLVISCYQITNFSARST